MARNRRRNSKGKPLQSREQIFLKCWSRRLWRNRHQLEPWFRTPMRCRHCGAQFKVESALSLETLTCPHCQQRPQPITLSRQLQHLLFSSISNVLKSD